MPTDIYDLLSTPHGALGTFNVALRRVEGMIDLSTPHGALGTLNFHLKP